MTSMPAITRYDWDDWDDWDTRDDWDYWYD